MDGVSVEVQARVDALQANVINESGALLRTCEHGIRHPVGHINSQHDSIARASGHEMRVGTAGYAVAQCDGCCANW